MIDSEAKRIIREFSLGIIASMNADGSAAASPKGTFLVLDDQTLAYGDIRSPATRANLTRNGACEVVFVDPFRRKGVRVKGVAQVHDMDSEFYAKSHEKWRDVWGDLADRVKALVEIKVSRVLPISTPPYDDGATEEEMIALYKQKYAEIYP